MHLAILHHCFKSLVCAPSGLNPNSHFLGRISPSIWNSSNSRNNLGFRSAGVSPAFLRHVEIGKLPARRRRYKRPSAFGTGHADTCFHNARLVQMRSILTSVPPRIASFWASLRDGEFRIRSTFDCQLNGSSVPKTTCPEPTSATRWCRPSSERTIVSTRICVFMYSLGCFLFSQSDLGRTWQATSVRPRYDAR